MVCIGSVTLSRFLLEASFVDSDRASERREDELLDRDKAWEGRSSLLLSAESCLGRSGRWRKS